MRISEKKLYAVDCITILNEGTAAERIARFLYGEDLTTEEAIDILNSMPRLRNDVVRINVLNALSDIARAHEKS